MANTVIRLGFIAITTGGGAGFEEYPNLAGFPPIGEPETIYVALDTNKTYRWSGSTYVEISPSEVISVNGKVGIVTLTKTDVGLSNVDNTSDLDKPISNATQTALDLITDVNWTGDYDNGVTYSVGDGVMYNGASFRMISFIGAAGYAPPAYPANWIQVTDYVSPNDIGLGNVDNTSDLDKPISSDTQDALDLKYDASNPAGYVDSAGASAAAPVQSVNTYVGDVVLDKSDVGLSNVDNTSDLDKPISTATQTALDGKANVSHNHALTDITQSSASVDQFVKWNGTNWVPDNLDASITDYSPSQPSDWLVSPTIASSALDELASRVTTINENTGDISEVFTDMKEPTGFVNRTDSAISFDNLTRIFTIQPTGLNYSVYHLGVKTTISSTLTLPLPNTSGNYYIYITNLGALAYSTTFDLALLNQYAYCSYIYYDAIASKAVIFGDERHGITMDGTTHGYLHTTRGTQLVSGAAISYTLGSGALDADAQISLGDMQIKDEDITVNINNDATPNAPFEQILFPIAEIPIVYREGSIWKKATATQFPMLVQSGDVRASFNENIAGVWQLTEAPSNNKTLVTYIFATTSVEEPVIGILGQSQYNNIDEARGAASWENISFGDLPSPEMKLLYTIYYDTSSGYTNPAKSKITYVADLRFTHDREVSAAVFNSDHANLSGLGGDDHLQYHNNARGDARYNLKSIGDISETGFSILNNQTSAQSITGFLFSNVNVRGFTALVTVKIEATSNLYEVFEIKGIQKDSDWNISIQSTGDISGISLSISSSGQMQYTSLNYPGFTSGSLKFKAFTTSV